VYEIVAVEVRFINATEGGILTEAVEILSLSDTLHQACGKDIDVRLPGQPSEGHKIPFEPGVSAISHLVEVLRSGAHSCGCFDAYLELTAKEGLLRGDEAAVNESILSGRRACEQICRTHAEGRAAPAH
jgi:hypothetical protein